MDLKDVVSRTDCSAKEAMLAFHAGHQDDAEKQLMNIMLDVGKYFDEKTTPAGDVTESATSEDLAEASKATPAQAPGAAAQPAAVDPAAAAQQVGGSLTDEKPSQ